MPSPPKYPQPNSPEKVQPPSGINRLPPPYPLVRLPNHPPYSPRPNLNCLGIGSCSPGSSSVINCPLNNTQQVITPSNTENLNCAVTPASSLDWDNYQSPPLFSGRKIPIVSTVSSGIEGIEERISELNLSLESVEDLSTIGSVNKENAASDMEAEIGELLDTKLVILCEITDNPVSNIRPGMEIMAEKDVSKVMDMRTKFRMSLSL